jgi:hypothetical protein
MMFSRLIALTVCLVMIAGCLLMLRQRRLELSNEMVRLHRAARQVELDLWQAEARAAALANPQHLLPKLDTSQLTMEPDLPQHPCRVTTLSDLSEEVPIR